MKILFTNNTLAACAGTELAIRDLCLEMRRRGHEVAAYSSQWGDVASALISEGIPVLDHPGQAPWTPDVIHGHHEWETTVAALRWPDRPVLSFCRGLEAWQEAPCRAPNVVHWIAVDDPCAERLVEQEGIPARQVTVVLNGIDLHRFRPRPPLPPHPGAALLFSNYAAADRLLPEVAQACTEENVRWEAAGAGVHRILERPEELLGNFDLVFAKGKAALEAVITGCAVIVCDVKGLGPLVTGENFEPLRRQSFGYPCMTAPISPDAIRSRLRQWDASASGRASDLARQNCGIQTMFGALESLYEEVRGYRLLIDSAAWAEFTADFLAPRVVAAKLGRQLQESHRNTASSPEAANAREASREHDRILDAYRKGQQARTEVKSVKKALNQATSSDRTKPRPRFMGLFN